MTEPQPLVVVGKEVTYEGLHEICREGPDRVVPTDGHGLHPATYDVVCKAVPALLGGGLVSDEAVLGARGTARVLTAHEHGL